MQPVHLLLLFSILFIIIGVIMIRKANRLRRVGLKAIATVIRNRYSKDDQGDDTHTPIVEFLTAKEELITIELSYGNIAEPKDIGDKVSIIYDPNNPREVSVNSFLKLVVGPWIFIVIGIVGVVFSGLAILGLGNIVMTE